MLKPRGGERGEGGEEGSKSNLVVPEAFLHVRELIGDALRARLAAVLRRRNGRLRRF